MQGPGCGLAAERRADSSKAKNSMGRASLLTLLLVCLASIPTISLAQDGTPGQCCNGGTTCPTPATGKAMFECSRNEWDRITQYPPWEWYQHGPTLAIDKQCQGGTNAYKACINDVDCGGGICAMPQISARDYMKNYMSCCRHCTWDMLYPAAAPIQFTKTPLAADNALYSTVQLMDCSNFAAEFDSMDVNNDGSLSADEFESTSTGWFSKTPMKQMAAQAMLNATLTTWTVDFNKDDVISMEEYIVLRHFWTPVLLGSTAPAVETGTLAGGPLGGLYMDDATTSVWVTTANNMLLNLYLNNSWPAAKTRQPRSSEENEMKKTADLDGSKRISLEEHYFRHFADIDKSGRLERWEFDLSLYNAEGLAPTRAPPLSFDDHDLDGNAVISWLERKRIFADNNPKDGALNYEEWRTADYPMAYGPFQGHTKGGRSIQSHEYMNYMLYHDCTVRGSLAYSRPLSSFPWDASCPLVITVHDQGEFGPFTLNPGGLAEVEGPSAAVGGYAVRAWENITARLLWSYKMEFVDREASARRNLDSYRIAGPDVANREFRLALLTEQDTVPPDWTCSESIWVDDGFVVSVNSEPVRADLYLIAGKLVISSHFVNFFCTLFFTVLFVGHIIWILEHRGNKEVFRPFYGEGVMDGLWWSIVTQTTVGYGDKAPGTGPGKVFAIFWMLFGLIMFGVFSGQVTVFLEDETAVNNIAGPNSIAGFRVGVLEKNKPLQIFQVYGFTPSYFNTLEEAFSDLEDKKIDALVASRADILNFYNTPREKNGGLKPALVNCGNPFKIVGFAIPPEALTQAQPAVRVCGYGRGVYATTYLTAAVNQAIRNMTRDNSLAAISSEEADTLNPPAVEEGSECEEGTKFNIPLIVAALLLLLLYTALIILTDNEKAQKLMHSIFAPSSAEEHPQSEDRPHSTPSDGEADSDQLKSKPKKDLQNGDMPPTLSQEHADEMIESAKRLGVFSAMQATDVRRMQREMKEQRFLMERMLKFFAVCSGLVLCSLAAMAGILIVIWGDQIQVANYD
mmetsp:Transcript_9601/g.22122  ORF Transcript_9601/g.22122 Transcript_9601/m.22122 type:complete len:1023 (+) Transcript_9601:107-3175(+)